MAHTGTTSTVYSVEDLRIDGAAPWRDFKLRCPDGRVRLVADRLASGFNVSGHHRTRGLWWHDLVDWPQVGIGSAIRNWISWQCPHRAPDGARCSLPSGHVSSLKLPHMLTGERKFVSRVTGYWPTDDPRRAGM